MAHEVLFEPITIRKVQIKNRLAFAPTGMGTADPDGGVNDQTLCHYVARAKGGAGLIVTLLEDAGIDYIHLSSGLIGSWKHTFPDEDGAILPEGAAVKQAVRIPVICPNFHDPHLAANAVREKKVDIVSLSRGLLADPQWPNKVQAGRTAEIQRCLRCNWCLQTLFQGFHTRCAINPNVGRERFMPEYFPPPRKGKGIPI